jgi:hypothetical protein
MLANDNLLVQFGLLPTVEDMKSFATTLLKWSQVYTDMNKRFKRIYRLRPEPTDIREILGPIQDTQDFIWSIPGMPNARFRATYQPLFGQHHRSLYYRLVCPEFKSWMARIKQFIDALGILDPAAIWDVIPFSFVVDWFINIGSWLHNNRPRLFRATISCEDYIESCSLYTEVTWEGFASWTTFIDEPGTPAAWQTIGLTNHKFFTRRRFNPGKVENSKTTRHPGSFLQVNRLGIIASLAAQRSLYRTQRVTMG